MALRLQVPSSVRTFSTSSTVLAGPTRHKSQSFGRPKRNPTTYGSHYVLPSAYPLPKLHNPPPPKIWTRREIKKLKKGRGPGFRPPVNELPAPLSPEHQIYQQNLAKVPSSEWRGLEDLSEEEMKNYLSHPLWAFFESSTSIPKIRREKDHSGRAWTIAELRQKSFEDLRTIWYLSLREINKLLTQIHHMKRKLGRASEEYAKYYVLKRKQCQENLSGIKRVISERRDAMEELENLAEDKLKEAIDSKFASLLPEEERQKLVDPAVLKDLKEQTMSMLTDEDVKVDWEADFGLKEGDTYGLFDEDPLRESEVEEEESEIVHKLSPREMLKRKRANEERQRQTLVQQMERYLDLARRRILSEEKEVVSEYKISLNKEKKVRSQIQDLKKQVRLLKSVGWINLPRNESVRQQLGEWRPKDSQEMAKLLAFKIMYNGNQTEWPPKKEEWIEKANGTFVENIEGKNWWEEAEKEKQIEAERVQREEEKATEKSLKVEDERKEKESKVNWREEAKKAATDEPQE